MATKKKFNLDALFTPNNTNFEMVQVLDAEGKVVNPDLVPDLSDDELVQLMTDMVWSRILHERSTALNRQGRLGVLRSNSWTRSFTISFNQSY